jgi:hypothetical protein
MEHYVVAALLWILPTTLFGFWLIRRYIVRSRHRRKALEYSLIKRGDPPCKWDEPHERLEFRGYTLIEAEETWDTELAKAWVISGTILIRVAIYKTLKNNYVAEISRANPTPIIINPEAGEQGLEPIPYLAYAQEFSNFNEASAWIQASDIYREGNISKVFLSQVEQLEI